MRPRPLPAPTHPSRTGETNQRPNRYRDVTTNNRTPTRHFLIYASNQLKRPSVTDFEDALPPRLTHCHPSPCTRLSRARSTTTTPPHPRLRLASCLSLPHSLWPR